MTGTATELASSLQTSAPQQRDDVSTTSYLACTRPPYIADLHWNRFRTWNRPQRPRFYHKATAIRCPKREVYLQPVLYQRRNSQLLSEN
ncbi:hypothetical protein AVEN_22612-1 [Araneus ventricosus]|uniref:Uncharacterized protein n=1 Tax=Araneus ventricosus TaxID=182803 RepID=A0A4Y2S0N7_ARAVE|nr:hypothetical protein AVEN_22612-1 [Araneus ventricosus]